MSTIDHAAARAALERGLSDDTRDFGNFFLLRWLGLSISYPEPDLCVVEFDAQDFMFNPQGSLHGGIIATVLDIAMGHLLTQFVARGTTLEMKTQYLRPGRVGRLRAEGRFLKKGKSINYLEATLKDVEGKAIAVSNATWQLIAQPGKADA